MDRTSRYEATFSLGVHLPVIFGSAMDCGNRVGGMCGVDKNDPPELAMGSGELNLVTGYGMALYSLIYCWAWPDTGSQSCYGAAMDLAACALSA